MQAVLPSCLRCRRPHPRPGLRPPPPPPPHPRGQCSARARAAGAAASRLRCQRACPPAAAARWTGRPGAWGGFSSAPRQPPPLALCGTVALLAQGARPSAKLIPSGFKLQAVAATPRAHLFILHPLQVQEKLDPIDVGLQLERGGRGGRVEHDVAHPVACGACPRARGWAGVRRSVPPGSTGEWSQRCRGWANGSGRSLHATAAVPSQPCLPRPPPQHTLVCLLVR